MAMRVLVESNEINEIHKNQKKRAEEIKKLKINKPETLRNCLERSFR